MKLVDELKEIAQAAKSKTLRDELQSATLEALLTQIFSAIDSYTLVRLAGELGRRQARESVGSLKALLGNENAEVRAALIMK